MPIEPGRAHRWLRPPRNLLLVLGLITVGSATALCWLGWTMLQRDREAAARGVDERLDLAADRVVQSFDQRLGDADDHLTRLSADVEAAPTPPGPGVFVLVTATGDPRTSSPLLFYPSVATRPEPHSALFAEGETAEYGGDPGRAAEIYRALTRSADPAVRATGFMALGRILRNSGRSDAALAAYTQMASLAEAQVIGLPADLVAGHARAEMLAQLGRPADAARDATAMLVDLANRRWMLTRGQFEHYAETLSQLGGVGHLPAVDVAVASAVSDLWNVRTLSAPRGQRLVRQGDVPLLVMWRIAWGRMAAWVVHPDALLRNVAIDHPGTDITLKDAEGFVIAGAVSRPGGTDRLIAKTLLPWTVHVAPDGSVVDSAEVTWAPVIVTGLAVMLGFLGAGAYFIARAVKQEMDLARLQSDFVSAVSHEFRTPLAAMRQLSELLAAGRVPVEERRQQYYESLAGESRRLQRLVENLLNVGRLEAGARPYQLAPLDPRALVEQVVAEFQSQLSRPDCRIEVTGNDDTLPLLADRDAVALALHNLIDNAVKYSGGSRPVRVAWARQDGRVALSVRDEGPGIAAEERERIFQKFVRGAAAAAANVRGTGVGLAMVQLVVAGHGGEVVVESQPGAGATFTMLLPAAESGSPCEECVSQRGGADLQVRTGRPEGRPLHPF